MFPTEGRNLFRVHPVMNGAWKKYGKLRLDALRKTIVGIMGLQT